MPGLPLPRLFGRTLVVVAIAAIVLAILSWRSGRFAPLPEAIQGPSALHREVDCGGVPRRNLLVLLVLGQSNAANHGEVRVAPEGPIFSFFDGRCYAAKDPLPGASGQGGSVWTRLAPTLLVAGSADAVLLVPWAAGSTSMAAWNRHPDLVEGLARTVAQLKTEGFSADMVLWQQVEMESFIGTSGEDYQAGFAKWLARLRGLGVSAPVWVAQSTRCLDRHNESVRAAQLRLPQALPGLLKGPDLDRLFNAKMRFDGCHFSEAGLTAAAQAWHGAISAAAPYGASTSRREGEGE